MAYHVRPERTAALASNIGQGLGETVGGLREAYGPTGGHLPAKTTDDKLLERWGIFRTQENT